MALEENTNNQQQAAQDLFTRTSLTPKPLSIDAQTMAGNTKTGPNPKPAGMSYVDQKVARLNGMMMDLYKPDENKYNKLTTYNSSHYGHNFERYYSHGKFKQLGFSPYRNNEEFYNNNSSLWNDASRGGRAALRLAGLGFSSTFTNWGSMFSDKPNSEEAEEMERLMSIGSSSREGFGAKVINFGVNAGYTYGVMSEIIAEEAALWLAGTFGALPSGGTTTAVAVARTGTNIGRAWKALKLLTKVDDARQAWRIAKTAGKGLREFVPLSQTTSLLTKTGRAAAKWDSLDNMAKISKGFGTFYRDLREINAVTSEAKLEGGAVKNDVANQLMAQFRKDHGREPSLAEAQAIAGQANKAGYLASQTNMAGIYVSNKIVLDRALKGIPGLQNLEKAATKSKAAFIFNKDWKKLATDPYSMIRGAKKYITPAYYKQVFNPKNLGKGGLNYLSANLMEGTQEVYQEAVAKGITDYFVNTYNNPNLAGSGYFRTMMESGLKSQASSQGLETFLSGFLMAGPISMTQTAFYKGYDAVRMKKLKNQAQKFSADPANAGKENPYQAQIDRELEFDQKTLEAMNEVTKDPVKYFNALEKDLKIQRDLALAGEQAALDGDMKFARDTRDTSLISHSIQLLNAGRFDVFQDQLKGLRNLSKEELQEAFGEDPAAEQGTIQERLEKVIGRTNEIRNVYEEYQNTVNPHSLKDEPEDYLAFEQMRNVMISNDIHFKFVANRMEKIYDQFSNTLPFQGANVTDFAPLFSIGVPSSEAAILRPGMRAEVEMLSKEIEALGDRPENAAKKEQLTKKKESLESLSGLSQLYLAQYLATQKVSQNEQSFEENSKALDETEELFKDSFFKHIKLLAEQNGQVVLDKDIEKTYQLYKDYWKLSGDKSEYANAINAFANPQMFAQMRGRLSNAMKAAMAVRKEKLKESLALYKKKYLTNNFLNDLFEKYNAFVDPDEAQAFLDDKEIPVTFYRADTLEEIEIGSEEYKGIMALIDEYDAAYFEETGKHYMKNVEGSLQSFRDKLQSDKRTANELGAEFGFDPTSRTTQVDARQVLQAVIKSKFADKDLKKLAQILSGMVPAGTQVTFKMDHHTNSTYDSQNGIIVDPRFSSEGYNIGVVPIEFSIMNAMMQMTVSEALQSDPIFNDAITNLRAKLAADTRDAVEKKLLSLALASNEGFVAEVMTSPLLQQKLESIPFTDNLTEQTEEAKTLWGTFIDEIKSLLKRLFGNKRAASVYDEAVTVITNKLTQPGVAPSITAEDEVEVDEQPVTEEDPALEALLQEGFQQALSELDPDERLGLQYESWKLTSPLAADIIKKYQANKVKQTVAKQDTASVPALTEEERKRIITDLGYTVEEMNNMGEAEIEEIIKEKRKKKLTLKRVSGDVEIEFDEFLPAEAVVENAVRDLKIKLEKANFKIFEKKDPKTGKVIDSWYAQADVRGEEIPGTRHERVSNVVKEKGDFAPGAAERGTVIDELLRDYLNGEITNIIDFKTKYNSLRQQYPSAIFSEAMLDELFDRFRTVQRQIKSLGLRVDARIPTLYGVLGPKMGTTEDPVNVAGSIDVLAFNSLGEVFIIDLKTSTQDRRAQYKLETDLENEFGERYPEIKDAINSGTERFKSLSETINSLRVSEEDKIRLKKVAEANPTEDSIFFYKAQDEAQQNAYAELLKQVSGIEVKAIVIFPLKVTKVGKTFTSVNFQKNAEGKYTMYVKGPGTTDIYDITGRENVITEYPENPISEEKLDELLGKGTEETTTPTATATTSEIDIVNTPGQDIINELNKLGSVNEKLEWLKNNNLIAPITIGGKSYNVIDYSDRVMVLMKIGKYNIPFYISTGQAGKKNVKAGNWYVVFGIGRQGWINKGSEAEINAQYDNPAFQKFARILNEGIGKIVSREDNGNGRIKEGIGYLNDDEASIAEFNTQMNLPTEPAPNHTASYAFYTHVDSTLNLINEEIKALKKEPQPTSTPTDIEAKKADIEKRKAKSISEIGLAKQGSTGTYVGYYESSDGKESSIYGNTKEQIEERLSKKYDAELADLEGTNAEKVTLNDIKPGDKFTDRKMGYQATVTSITKDGIIFYDTDKVSGDMPFEDFIKEFTRSTEAPVQETNEEKVAKLRAQEQKDLLNAIPNIESYKDAEGKVDTTKLSPLELQMYNDIYERYDKLISPLLGVEPKTDTQVKKANKPAERVELTDALRDILKENPELAAIGTPEQYAEYLSSIFPESVLKNIFYRGTTNPDMLEAEDLDPKKGTGAKNLGIGIYWTPDKRKADSYATSKGRTLAAILNVRNFYITSLESNWSRGFLTPNNLTVSELTNGADTLISFKGLDRDTQVAQETGTSLVYIGRYEGPVDEQGLPDYQEFSRSKPYIGELAVESNEQVHILGSKKDIQGFKDFVSKPKTGTQTQMDFDELTLNIGDRVKVNTLKDGEGIIKEDRGDKVLLEDGRQIMKKNLTKLTTTNTEAPKSIVTPELQGKVIYVTPSTESRDKLFNLPGVVYGNIILSKFVIGDFSDQVVEKLRDLIELDLNTENRLKASIATIKSKKEGPKNEEVFTAEYTLPNGSKKDIKNSTKEALVAKLTELHDKEYNLIKAAQTVINAIDTGVNPENIKDLLYAISILRFAKPESGVPQGLPVAINYMMTNLVWDKTMAEAKKLADQGVTVVFDNNEAAASNKVDFAFVGETDLTANSTPQAKANIERAVNGVSPTKVLPLSGAKNILDILQGKVQMGVQQSKAMSNIRSSIYTANKLELAAIKAELNSLKSLGLLPGILQQQNATSDQVREDIAKREELLKDRLDINDLSVEDIVMYTEQKGGKTVPGMIVKKNSSEVSVVPISLNEEGETNESLNDLFNKSEVSTFTSTQLHDFIFPMAKEETPVTPDPDVKAQSDAATQEAKSTPAEQGQRLKDNINADPNKTAKDAVNEFLDGLCKGKSKKQ